MNTYINTIFGYWNKLTFHYNLICRDANVIPYWPLLENTLRRLLSCSGVCEWVCTGVNALLFSTYPSLSAPGLLGKTYICGVFFYFLFGFGAQTALSADWGPAHLCSHICVRVSAAVQLLLVYRSSSLFGVLGKVSSKSITVERRYILSHNHVIFEGNLQYLCIHISVCDNRTVSSFQPSWYFFKNIFVLLSLLLLLVRAWVIL